MIPSMVLRIGSFMTAVLEDLDPELEDLDPKP